MGRTALKWIASIGSGGLTTLLLALIVLSTNLDVTSARGAALVTIVGTLATWVSNYAVSKTGPAKPSETIARPTATRPRAPRPRPINGANEPGPGQPGDKW